MRASCGKVTNQANLRKGWPLIHIVTLSTNFESTFLLSTEQEFIEPMLSRYIWKGHWIKCNRHQEKKARGRLLELKQDWVCIISKDIPEEKPCREDGRANKELSAALIPHSQPNSKNMGNKAWRGLLIILSTLKLTSGRGTICSGPPRMWRPQELSETRSSSSAVMSTLPPPLPSCWPPLFVCAVLLSPRGALSLWFHSLSQCGLLLIGIMYWHGVGKTTGFNFS